MNKLMFDLLVSLKDGSYSDNKKMAQRLYKPYSIIEQELEQLYKEGFASNLQLTEKGESYLEDHKIKNAIAATMAAMYSKTSMAILLPMNIHK